MGKLNFAGKKRLMTGSAKCPTGTAKSGCIEKGRGEVKWAYALGQARTGNRQASMGGTQGGDDWVAPKGLLRDLLKRDHLSTTGTVQASKLLSMGNKKGLVRPRYGRSALIAQCAHATIGGKKSLITW